MELSITRSTHRHILEGQSTLLNADGLLDGNKFSSQGLEAYAKSIYSLDINSLQFVWLHGSQAQEILNANGALIIKTIKATDLNNGEPIIQRVIDPMSGSGTYPNFVRAIGFNGNVVINDAEEILMITQKQIVNNPDAVLDEIKLFKERITNHLNAQNLAFDSDLVYTVPNNARMEAQRIKLNNIKNQPKTPEAIEEAKSLTLAYRAEARLYWTVLSSTKLNTVQLDLHGLRDIPNWVRPSHEPGVGLKKSTLDVQNIFPEWIQERGRFNHYRKSLDRLIHEELDACIRLDNAGKEVVVDNAKTAAVYYVLQNNAHGFHEAIEYIPKTKKSGQIRKAEEKKFYLPVGVLTALDITKTTPTFGLHIAALRRGMSEYIERRSILNISKWHSNAVVKYGASTDFSHQDGWALIAQAQPRDLVILSGQFSNKYLSTQEFANKINEVIVPATTKQVRVLINNRYMNGVIELEKELRAMGFKTGVSTHAQNGQRYLVATNYDPQSAGLDMLPIQQGQFHEVGKLPTPAPKI